MEKVKSRRAKIQIFALILRGNLLCFVPLETAAAIQSDGDSLQISDTRSHAVEIKD